MKETAETQCLESRIISLKKMLEKEKRFSESIFQSAPVAIIGVSTANNVLMANRKAEELFGKSTEEILGVEFGRIVAGANPFGSGSGIDMTLPWNGCAICWKSSLVRDDDGTVIGAMLFGMTFEQISSSTIWSERMDAVQSFVGSLAHDLNNLLGAISGYSSLVQTFAGTEDKMLTYLKALDTSIKRMSDITARSIRFAHTIKPRRESFRLNERLNALCNTWLEKKTGVNIEKRFNNTCDQTEADWMMIEESVTALLDNAFEAMPENGIIWITTEEIEVTNTLQGIPNYPRPGRYLKINLRDNGKGMDRETIPKAFMPFFSTRDKGKGSGMGLTIAYSLIKQHNGYLTLESEPGKGTAASIYLPVQSSAERIDIEEIIPKEEMIP
jgi:PAS domain S-box-containing protein